MTMTPARALDVALYVLVLDGLVGLWLGGLLTLPALVLVAVAVAASWPGSPPRRRLASAPRLRAALVGGLTLALAVDVLAVAPTMLDVFTHLLVLLLLVKLHVRRTLRDARDAAFLAFFLLVAVAPMTSSLAFLALLVVFVVAGTWLLLLRHLLVEAEQAPAAAPAPAGALGLGRGLLPIGAVAALGVLVVATGLFVAIPRLGQAALPMRAPAARLVSGFTERVELGAFGEIELDDTVVMRVHLPGWTEGLASPETLPWLRWRGMAFDRFDGRAWTIGRAERITIRRTSPVPFPVGRYRGGRTFVQEIFLDPLGTNVVFGAPRLLYLQSRSDEVTLDDLGNVVVPLAAARLRYTVESEPELGDPRGQPAPELAAPADPRWRARYTALPPLPPRIAALARQVTAGAADPYEAAQRLTTFLGRELAYSRVLERQTDLHPLEEFLFVARRGNCEYFAAALAVMLRAVDVPARVVNGFQRGEWNPYGGYFMVRLRDAHSWVEAFVDGAGWVTLDPSPRAGVERRAAPGAARLWLDAVRMSWYRYVVNWGLGDQLAVAEAFGRASAAWGSSALDVFAGRPDRGALIAAALAVAALALVRRARTAALPVAAATTPPRFYARALRALARGGLAPAPAETAREFAARVTRVAPALSLPLGRVTDAYERVRFGGASLSGDETSAIDACVDRLRVSSEPVQARRA